MVRGFAPGAGAGGRVRLRTLSNLRWLAVAGQSAALFLVYFVLGYSLPILYCAIGIAVSAGLNVVLALRYPASHRLTNREATFYLAFDVLQLAALLYLTGGIANPFALMFVAPVVIAASTLNLGNVLILAGIAFASVSLIAIAHRPLPWPAGEELFLPELYQAGIWTALVIGIGFTSVYAWRIASESSRMSAGLAATQLALSREHRLSSLGALATAAAHELGTPLGTIAVVARELEHSLPENSAEVEDVRLLREQAERCRAIIARLANRKRRCWINRPAALGAFWTISPLHRGDDLRYASRFAPKPRHPGGVARRWNPCTGCAISSRTLPTPHALGGLPAGTTSFSCPWPMTPALRRIFSIFGRALHHFASWSSCPGRNRYRPARPPGRA
jgi:hypothetical protein